MYRLTVFLLVFFTVSGVFADAKIGINGAVEWDTMRIKAVISLDLASAGIKIPSGRIQGESLLLSNYLSLILPSILELQVDSSSTISDLINRGEFNLSEVEAIALKAQSIPPALSPELKNMSVSYNMNISGISSAFIRHRRPSPIMRTLNPVSAARYTGIVIIASDELPIHGMKSKAMPVPCLFPKIWDSEMNLIYERNMLEAESASMVSYAPLNSIFQKNPSGLSAELIAAVGERPLRIFANGVFGSTPTDLVIDRNDAMLIISSEENRRLLTEGRVVILLNDSVLRSEFSGE
ncbi:MAG: polymerase [Treponema sp.]|jgi:hypothetical protein|nr:polymerase [Treponema sp.]